VVRVQLQKQRQEQEVTSSPVAEPENDLVDLVARLTNKGIRLQSEKGQLVYRAPKGCLDGDDMETLRACKSHIVDFLEGGDAGDGVSTTAPTASARIHLAPLAFSQLAHWRLYQLSQPLSHVVTGFPTRWRGRLNEAVLQRAICELIRRHDALRTRIILCAGGPMQEIRDFGDYELVVDDLTELEASTRERELKRLISKHMLDPIDVGVFPLFRFRLIRVEEDDHVLVMVIEHIITDGVSLNLLHGELLTIYQDVTEGRAPSLPPAPQFSDYAFRQRGMLRSWIEQHASYWQERMKGCQRLRFPDDRLEHVEGLAGTGTVVLRIHGGLRAAMGEWCRRMGTTLVMGFFVAYVAVVLRWCDVSESMIVFQVDGRADGGANRIVGYLASVLYLRVGLLESDTFVDLLRRVTEEYCNAHEHADASYMEAQASPPDFTRNSCFNWLREGIVDNRIELERSEQVIEVSRVPFLPRILAQFERDEEPGMGFSERDDEIVACVHFPRNRFSVGTMERFASNFLRFVDILLQSPDANVKNIPLE
jgi:hypothetical protein